MHNEQICGVKHTCWSHLVVRRLFAISFCMFLLIAEQLARGDHHASCSEAHVLLIPSSHIAFPQGENNILMETDILGSRQRQWSVLIITNSYTAEFG